MANNKDTIKACLATTILIGSLVITGTLDRNASTPPVDGSPSCSNVDLPAVGETVLCTPYGDRIDLAPDGCGGGPDYSTLEVKEVAQYTHTPATMTCNGKAYYSAP